MKENLKEECGVLAACGNKEASTLVYLGLYALQHRGQEGCGIISFDPDYLAIKDSPPFMPHFRIHKSFGLVSDSFNKDVLKKLKGTSAIGHVRYSTHGGRFIQNVQPFHFQTSLGPIAIAHNGNLTNAIKIRTELEKVGCVFHSSSDTEIFVHLLARSDKKTIKERIADVMQQVKGAYSLVIMASDEIYAVRDSFGFRPLCVGKKDKGWIVASETCALDLLDADFVRDVMPGEVLQINSEANNITECESIFPLQKKKTAFCSFEPIYFSRPDSCIAGKAIYDQRRRIGEILARESKDLNADLVIAIPDSGVPMALGYAAVSKLPLELGLVRNHYVGRTFIEPEQSIRDFGVKLKLNPIRSILKGKKVIVIDDSIVRGTTSIKIMRMLKKSGVKEIHLRIGSPPIISPCFYGVNTPEKSKLLAANENLAGIKEIIGCDSLAYISFTGLQEAIGEGSSTSYCYACFNEDYAEELTDHISS